MKTHYTLLQLLFALLVTTSHLLSQSWMEFGGLLPSNDYTFTHCNDISIANEGNTIAISNGFRLGQVLIFDLISNNWVQRGEKIISNTLESAFGWSISLSDNGTYLIIGAVDSKDERGERKGSCFVFQWKNDMWEQKGNEIFQPNHLGTFGSAFGRKVDISNDGNIIVASKPSRFGGLGEVFTFHYVNEEWLSIGTIVEGTSHYGNDLEMSSDGLILAIGMPEYDGPDQNNINTNAGGVITFTWINNNWMQLGDIIEGEHRLGEFGYSLDLNSKGNKLVISAPYGLNDQNQAVGQIFAYEFEGGSWSRLGTPITGQDITKSFGFSVGISKDGRTLIGSSVASFGGAFISDGFVQVFNFVNNAWEKKGDDIIRHEQIDEFGANVEISDNGNIIYISSGYNYDLEAAHVQSFSLNNISNVKNIEEINYQLVLNDNKIFEVFFEEKFKKINVNVFGINGQLLTSYETQNSKYISGFLDKSMSMYFMVFYINNEYKKTIKLISH